MLMHKFFNFQEPSVFNGNLRRNGHEFSVRTTSDPSTCLALGRHPIAAYSLFRRGVYGYYRES